MPGIFDLVHKGLVKGVVGGGSIERHPADRSISLVANCGVGVVRCHLRLS